MSNIFKGQEKIDLDDKQLDIIRKQTELLERYEGRIQALLQEKLDNLLTHDMWEERQAELRREFMRQYEEITKEIDYSIPEHKFRDAVYNIMLQQVRRGFGYYRGLVDANEKVKQYNMELGDEVFSIDSRSHMEVIEKIDNIKFAMELIDALGMQNQHKERIVEHLIDRAFKPKQQ